MATLAQIRQTVSRKLKDESNTGTSALVVTAEINRSIRFYSNHRFWFNEDLADITLTKGAQLIPSIPTDLSVEIQGGLVLIDDQVKIPLQRLSNVDFYDSDQDQTGRPYYYTYRDGNYYVLPTPNEAYPLKFRYLKKYSDLVNDSDTNDFTSNAEDLIMLHTVKNIYAEDKQDSERAGFYSQLEDVELSALKNSTDSRISSGYLQIRSIL
jgi:hypothetical protein